MGVKGPYIGRDVYVKGETVRIWGIIVNPIKNYGEIWSNVDLSLWFECPGQMYRKCYYPYWPAGRKRKLIMWKFRPGEKYPYEGSFEFKFKARLIKNLNAEKPCNITSTQKWRGIVWYGPPPLDWYRKICERGGSWREFVNHPRCLGMLEWTVTEAVVPPPKIGYMLPLAVTPVAAVSSIVAYHEVSKRK